MWVRKLLLSLLLSRQDHDTIRTALYYLQQQRADLHRAHVQNADIKLTLLAQEEWMRVVNVYRLFGGRL